MPSRHDLPSSRSIPLALATDSQYPGQCSECGLDYDRLFFSPKDVQLRHFALHFDLAAKHGLPLFLHDRNTSGDFLRIMRAHRHRVPGGVVHSFTGTAGEAKEYLDMGLQLGINGCSLKTEENLAVVRGLPLDRLLLETGESLSIND